VQSRTVANFMIDGRRIIGVSESDSDPQRFLPYLVELFENGLLPVDRLIRHYPFEEVERAALAAARLR
jgi:aryl-alcohol dehydrogenase